MTRQDYLTAIDNLVPGGSELPLGQAEKIMAIAMAVKEHSRHNPQILVQDITGAGTFDYALSGLTYYSDGFSQVRSVEYPVDDTDETPDILVDSGWMIYQKPAGKYLRFLEDSPSATESIRVTYTALHTCTDSASTIQEIDDEAVQSLASSKFCEMLATYYAQTGDSSMAADSVDHKSKSSEYSSRARLYRKMYYDHIGTKEGSVIAASATIDWDNSPSWGTDRATHPKRYR